MTKEKKEKKMKEVVEEVVFGGDGPAELAPEERLKIENIIEDSITTSAIVIDEEETTDEKYTSGGWADKSDVVAVPAKKGNEVVIFGKLYRVIKVKSNRRLELQEVKPKR